MQCESKLFPLIFLSTYIYYFSIAIQRNWIHGKPRTHNVFVFLLLLFFLYAFFRKFSWGHFLYESVRCHTVGTGVGGLAHWGGLCRCSEKEVLNFYAISITFTRFTFWCGSSVCFRFAVVFTNFCCIVFKFSLFFQNKTRNQNTNILSRPAIQICTKSPVLQHVEIRFGIRI